MKIVFIYDAFCLDKGGTEEIYEIGKGWLAKHGKEQQNGRMNKIQKYSSMSFKKQKWNRIKELLRMDVGFIKNKNKLKSRYCTNLKGRVELVERKFC